MLNYARLMKPKVYARLELISKLYSFTGNQILSFVSAFILAYVTDRQMLVDMSAGVLVFVFMLLTFPLVFFVLT